MASRLDALTSTMTSEARGAVGGRLILMQGNSDPLVAGNPGGKPGRSWRTPDAFKAMCRELASREEMLAAVDEILRDRSHPMFMAALNWATNHSYGKAKETLEEVQESTPPARHVWTIAGRELVF